MIRKLTAILSADVQGYSRLMGENEEATIRTLTAYREVMTRLIQQHRGRVVDSPGDNLLAEFASAVDAVQGAVAIQQALKTRNAELPVNRQMHYRIGINVGDVVVEGERIYGDGVNIAARLESLAEGGGICISGTVYDQIENKLALSYAYGGEQAVKNIAKPVRMYKVGMEAEGGAIATLSQERPIRNPTEERQTPRRWSMAALATVVGLLAGAGVLIWEGSIRQPTAPPAEVSSEEASALPLPAKLSIAVLPFMNLSGDPTQDTLSNGMTETLITDLSKVSGLSVIAHHSGFTYKDQAAKVEEVGRELEVSYVIEGSVQKSGDRVRVNIQLIDTTTGQHLWADRYDEPLENLLALQDAIVQRVVAVLKLRLEEGFQATVTRTTDNLEAYAYALRWGEAYARASKESNAHARQLAESALALEPNSALAYQHLALTYVQAWMLQWTSDPHTLDRAVELGQKAVALDGLAPGGHGALGWVYLWNKQHAQALAEVKHAVALDPNNANTHAGLASVLNYVGRPEDAIASARQALRLNPQYPVWFIFPLAQAYQLSGQHEAAVAAYQSALSRKPDSLWAHLGLALTYSAIGREGEAQVESAEVRRINPDFSLEVWKQRAPIKDPAVLEQHVAALRKAGLE